MSYKMRGFSGFKSSPAKQSIWDSKETTPSITKSAEAVKTDVANYQKTQKQPTGKNKKFVDAVVNTIVPESGVEALGMLGGAGIVKGAKVIGKGYQALKAAKTVKTTGT